MKSVTFYAYLDREDGSSHGACLASPVFRIEPDLVSWIRAHREPGDEVQALRREVDGAIVNDFPLRFREDPPADKERLHRLIADLKDMLDKKKLELDQVPSRKRPYSSVSEFNPIERPLTYDEVYPKEETA